MIYLSFLCCDLGPEPEELIDGGYDDDDDDADYEEEVDEVDSHDSIENNAFLPLCILAANFNLAANLAVM